MKNKNISRRDFLRRLGLGVGVTGLALSGCDRAANKPTDGNAKSIEGISEGSMTYRTNPKTGEKVSILGYGCMRWPT
ncbi:MAG: twin-arginine translocation signal domain-containing protein, partial [Muribaculaceae bacterium]|nr:twin-arginine translocation signal domain-containing protein [Muribaculaceae bacterium]